MRALIGLGSNLGDRTFFLQTSLDYLSAFGYRVEAVSSVYSSDPIEGCTLPFLNACAIIESDFPAKAFLIDVLEVEKKLGRDRSSPRKDRCIDLDILLFRTAAGKTINFNEEVLQVPHARMLQRDFVMVPACEIAGDWLFNQDQTQTLSDFLRPSGLQSISFQLRCP